MLESGCRSMIDGRLDLVEHSMRADIERFQHEGWISISYGLLATTLFWAGRWVEAELAWREPIQREPPGVLQGGVQALLMTARAYRSTPGALESCRRSLATCRRVTRSTVSASGYKSPPSSKAFAILDRRDDVAGLYPIVRQGLEIGDIIAFGNLQLWQMLAGMAAGAGQQWTDAEDHFETALRQAHTLPHKIAQPEVRRWYAWMLLDRNQPGDMEKARTLLNEAIEMYSAIGMPKHVELTKRLLART